METASSCLMAKVWRHFNIEGTEFVPFFVRMKVSFHRHEGFITWLMGKLLVYWEFLPFLNVSDEKATEI